MSNVISALTARTQLGQIIKRATEKNERFLVDLRRPFPISGELHYVEV